MSIIPEDFFDDPDFLARIRTRSALVLIQEQ
jgi:hypothetical protein